MSLTGLPGEILEIILLQVNVEDILSVFSVVRTEVCENFWKKICFQNGYNVIPGAEESWKEVFYRNANWLKGIYVKKEYNIREFSDVGDISRNSEYGEVCETHFNNRHGFSSNISTAHKFFLKMNTLLSQNGDEVFLYDVENPQKLLQKLHGEYVFKYDQSSSKLVVRTPSSLVIYSREKGLYKQLFVLNDINCYSSSYTLTDEYFAVIKTDSGNVLIIDLDIMEEYYLTVSCKKVIPLTISSCDQILNIVILDQNSYIMRNYHVRRKEWSEDILLSSNAVMIGIPEVKMSSKIIVVWSTLFDNQRRTPLKILTKTEDMNGSPNFVQVPSVHLIIPRDVLWIIVEEEFVLFTTSSCSFSVFNVRKPENIRIMPLPRDNYLGQNVISGLLVFSYTYCFKIVDFKKAVYLSEIRFESGFTNIKFCINEYFYMVFGTCNQKDDKKLSIYDFRGEVLSEN